MRGLLLPGALVAGALALPAAAAAQELVDPRVVGMGGVAAGFSDDSTAFFENPAGLARLERLRAEIVSASLMFSEATWATVADAQRAAQAPEEEIADALDRLVGRDITFNAGFFPNVTWRNFGVGLVLNGEGDTRIRNHAYPRLEAEGGLDASGVFAGGYGFLDGALSVGAQATLGKRAQYADYVGPATIAGQDYDFRAVVREGFGMTFSAGVQVVSPGVWHPRLGVVVKHLAGFNLGDPAPIFVESQRLELSEIPTEIAVGVGTSEVFGPLRLRLGLAHDNVTTTESVFKHLHLGAEALLWNLVALRGGIWQGYFTAGVGLDLRYIRVEYASYGLERGAFAGQRQERRHVIQLALGF